MGSAPRRATNGEKGFYAKGWKEWGKNRGGHGAPRQLSEGQVCEMVKLKLGHRHWGPRKIRTLYQRCHGQAPSESSFKRILEQVGLTQPRRIREGPKEGRTAEQWAPRAKPQRSVDSGLQGLVELGRRCAV